MRVEEQIVVSASMEDVWKVIEDFDEYERLLAGITRWESEDRRRRGQGARYQIRMEVGSAQVGSLVEIVEWDPPCDLAWTSITGLDQQSAEALRMAVARLARRYGVEVRTEVTEEPPRSQE